MIELIPAIDIIDGKCVRLSQGDYDSKKVYNENPVEVALELEAHGIRRLHVVDLDGAASHHVVNYRTLEQIAVRTSLIIDFGCEQHDEVIQQISSFINQAFVRTVASLNDGFHSLFAYLLCHFVDTGLEKTGRIGTFGHFIITLTDEILKKL